MNVIFEQLSFMPAEYLGNIWKLIILSPVKRQAVKIICAQKLRKLLANIPKISPTFN